MAVGSAASSGPCRKILDECVHCGDRAVSLIAKSPALAFTPSIETKALRSMPSLPSGRVLVLLAEDLRLEDNLAVAMASGSARDEIAVVRVLPEARGRPLRTRNRRELEEAAERRIQKQLSANNVPSRCWMPDNQPRWCRFASASAVHLSFGMRLTGWQQRQPISASGSDSWHPRTSPS